MNPINKPFYFTCCDYVSVAVLSYLLVSLVRVVSPVFSCLSPPYFSFSSSLSLFTVSLAFHSLFLCLSLSRCLPLYFLSLSLSLSLHHTFFLFVLFLCLSMISLLSISLFSYSLSFPLLMFLSLYPFPHLFSFAIPLPIVPLFLFVKFLYRLTPFPLSPLCHVSPSLLHPHAPLFSVYPLFFISISPALLLLSLPLSHN